MSRLKFFEKLATGFLGLTILFSSTNSAQAEENSKAEKKIIINSASRILTLYEGNTKLAIYPLGLGKVSTPTPVGYFTIQTKEVNPSWIDPSNPEYEVPSGPNNPLGYRWMRIKGNYGIHGTNKPNSIGHYVSNGCIRMNEADVEKLFDVVKIGTPVEITYNRVVVEKAPDENIVYYIYPDGYKRQKLNAEYVKNWIEPYGVAPFESDEAILQKIKSSDGQPTYLGKPYNVEIDGKIIESVEVNGRNFSAKAVQRDNINYLPVVPIAMALKTKLEWRAEESTLKTARGEVTGYEKRRQLYCNADDAIILFNIDGGLQNISKNPADGKIFKFYKMAENISTPTETIEKPVEVTTTERPVDENSSTKELERDISESQTKNNVEE